MNAWDWGCDTINRGEIQVFRHSPLPERLIKRGKAKKRHLIQPVRAWNIRNPALHLFIYEHFLMYLECSEVERQSLVLITFCPV
jgi:hypothetical protein